MFLRRGKRYREIYPPEAIAAHYGFGREGGNRNFFNDSTESNHSIDPLVKTLRLSFDRRTGSGFFLRAESFFNSASHIGAMGLSFDDGKIQEIDYEQTPFDADHTAIRK